MIKEVDQRIKEAAQRKEEAQRIKGVIIRQIKAA